MDDELVTQQTVYASTHLRMPWANGQGQTVELLRYPKGSSMDDMEFRVSVASLSQPGPFSRFMGLERTLLLLDSSEIVLTVDGESTRLSQHEQLSFSGESVTELASLTAPARDLNVMCRKGVWSSSVIVLQLDDDPTQVPNQGDVTVWVFASGDAQDSTGRGLESLDMAISREMPKWSGTGVAVRIDLNRA